MARKIGFIGLGNMGKRLAANLLEDNGSISVWDRSSDKLENQAPANADKISSIDELVDAADVIFISVSNDDAVRDVCEQIAENDITDKVIVDMSTIAPGTSIDLAKLIAKKGGQLLDAAVSGSTPQVEDRVLTIFVGGDKQTYTNIKDLLEPLGRKTYYMGENGKGLKMKLCVNLLLGVGLASIAETVVLAQKLGLDKSAAIEALSGTAVMSPSQNAKIKLAKDDNYSPATFSLELMHKDLELILKEADSFDLPLAVVSAAHQLAHLSLSKGAKEDFAVMIREAERLAGL